jgi:glycosyltransferase 2 family protein
MATKKLFDRQTILRVSFIALAAYVAFGIWGEIGENTSIWSQVQWPFVIATFSLTLVGYVFRFSNWQYYLSSLEISVPRKDSLLIFIGGFALGVTPGKVGEIVRSALLKERYGVPVSKTASLLIVDRLTDVLALLIIGSIGAAQMRYGLPVIAALTSIALGGTLILSSKQIRSWMMRCVSASPKLSRYQESINNLYETTQELLRARRVLTIILLSAIAWSCEAIGFFMVFQALSIDVSIDSAFFIYSFSTLLGAVALLPGGLGLTEGTFTGLLILLNVSKQAATAATVIIRLATLWFGLVLGLFCLAILENKKVGIVKKAAKQMA